MRTSSLVVALLEAESDRKSGLFEITSEEAARTRVYVASGRVVFAEEGTLADAIGRVLVREHKLTDEQYAATLAHLTERPRGSSPMRFGEAVVTLGFVPPEVVREALSAQVRDKTIHCLMQEDLTWTFTEATERLDVGHFPHHVGPLVVAAARRFRQERVERILEMSEARYPRLLRDADAIASLFELSSAERRVLGFVTGAFSALELVNARHPEVDYADALLAACTLGKLAELSPHPTAARGQSPPLPDGRGDDEPSSTPSAEPVDDPSALDADPFVRAATAKSAGASVAAGAAALPVARVALSPARAPVTAPTPPTDPNDARLLAEQAFQTAKLHLRSHALGRALPELRKAAALCPESHEFALYASWASFTAGGTANEEPGAADRERLHALADRAVKHDPNLAFGFFVLGQLAMLDGTDDAKTARLFRHALKLDPDLVEARRYLRLAKLRAANPKKQRIEAPAKEKPGDGSSSMLGLIMSTLNRPAAEPRELISEPPPSLPLSTQLAPPRAPSPSSSSIHPLEPIVEAAPATLSFPKGPRSTPDASSLDVFPVRENEASASSASPGRKAGGVWLALGVLGWVVAASAIGALYLERAGVRVAAAAPAGSNAPNDPPAASSPPVAKASPSAAAAAPSATAPVVAASASSAPLSSASPASAPSGSAPPVLAKAAPSAMTDATTGRLVFPATARGHRVFVDGHVIPDVRGAFELPCGAHDVKIGSSGTSQSVEVPCGGEVRVP